MVVVCYGINDGIYYPFSEERFAKYREGIREMLARARAAGAKVTLMTPQPFVPVPVGDKALPATAPKFSWVAPYVGYDHVVARYSDWLLTLRPQVAAAVDMQNSRSNASWGVPAVISGSSSACSGPTDPPATSCAGDGLVTVTRSPASVPGSRSLGLLLSHSSRGHISRPAAIGCDRGL